MQYFSDLPKFYSANILRYTVYLCAVKVVNILIYLTIKIRWPYLYKPVGPVHVYLLGMYYTIQPHVCEHNALVDTGNKKFFLHYTHIL